MRIVIDGDHRLLDRSLYRAVRRGVLSLIGPDPVAPARVRVRLTCGPGAVAVRCDIELLLAGRPALRTGARGATAAAALGRALGALGEWFGRPGARGDETDGTLGASRAGKSLPDFR